MRIYNLIRNQASCLIIILFCTNNAQSQHSFFNDSVNTSKNFNIELNGNFTAKSNAFPNSFYNEFYQGGYLTDEVKQKAAKNLKNINRFGADAEFGLAFRHHLDTVFKQTGWSYIVKLAEKRHLNIEMTKDFFNIGFFGNAMYENKTANLANFQLDYVSYQQIGLGLEKTWLLKENRHQVALIANFLNGRNAQRALVTKANLFTATDGEYLDLEISGKYNRTDSLENKQMIPLSSKGAGFSIDINYQLITKENYKLQISIIDFGYLYWKNSAIAYSYDTLFRFEGINIPNLVSINDSLIKLSSDTLIDLGKRNTAKSFKTVLPAWLAMQYSHILIPEKLTLNFVGRYRFNDVYLPFIAVGGTYYLNKNTNASLSIGYGGYGIFNYSLMIQQRVWKYFTIGLGSNQIEGLVMPNKASGQSAVFSIKSWF
jgi:hypothetical protein